MALLLCLVAAQILSAHQGASVPLDGGGYCMDGEERCKRCPAGQYQSSCTECSPCAEGTFTKDWNCESSCFPCFRDCRAVSNMWEEQKCSRTADVRCRCQRGYVCTNGDSGDCRECDKSPEPEPTSRGVVSDGITSPLPCNLPNCKSGVSTPVDNATHDSPHVRPENSNTLLAVLCPAVTIGILALLLLFCIRRQGDEACFKHVLQLCNEGVKDGSHNKAPGQQQTKEPVGLLPHPLTAANLGPVHVHSAGTVIFSLLNQFTGQGEVAGVERKEERNDRNEEEGRSFQNHAASSPDVHFSQQEVDGETGAVFVPSQEQGKDCHVSKEESP
ncbi:tumor necrosis factor receptor superfamily member 5 isoform X2 [Hypomesus transpacificus]|uniref:tumor necrosis factor receptor superfamily member 5 isoform X2 n=1 Tax=Hypomesus transpacificus TaxID=137520 RepID=UPI001F07E26F|nr:tumor necrosis factor receptor superfamily member 5 isoform X2 [Hypomesus transpacificus]